MVYEVNARLAESERVLYTFTGKGDGERPNGGLARDEAGNLYGTAGSGGTSNAGVVFMLSPAGQETVLYNFTGGADGGDPQGGVIRDAAGDLFGTDFGRGDKGWRGCFQGGGAIGPMRSLRRSL